MAHYNLFISHSWNYPNAYSGLLKLLETQAHSRRDFSFRNYSIPKDDPVHSKSDKELLSAIYNKMLPCSAIIVLAGVYATYSRWINAEIVTAKEGFLVAKPVIAVRPWASEKISAIVQKHADVINGWSGKPIVDKIIELVGR